MREPDDLTGRRFGKLTAIDIAGQYVSPSGLKRYLWNCVCDCGNRCVVRSDYLRNGSRQHCKECPPPAKTEHDNKKCRNCQHSERRKDGSWICNKGLNPNDATKECAGYLCCEKDKITGVKHRESRCLICGKPIYSIGNNMEIYCEDHKAYASLDNKLLDNMPFELMMSIIASIFIRARDDYLFNTDGKRKDAEKFFRSEWARELTLWNLDADETIKILNEVIENGLE